MHKNKSSIVSFNGQEGSGKSTVAKMVAEELGWPRYYMGQIFRDMAEEKGVTLSEFRKICEVDPDFDRKVDDRIVGLSKEQGNFIIESRTAWHFIPDSLKIYLKVDSSVAAERIHKAITEEGSRANEDTGLNSVENIQKSILKRRKEDNERYLALYNISQDDEKNYDLVIDTTKLTVKEVYETVIESVKSKYNEKFD